jgi:hypothetical protein
MVVAEAPTFPMGNCPVYDCVVCSDAGPDASLDAGTDVGAQEQGDTRGDVEVVTPSANADGGE